MDMMAIRRRVLLGQKKNKLIHWLTGDDAPIDGKWIDRITGETWTLNNGATHDPVNGLYLFDEPIMNASFDGSFSTGFPLGHHWIFEFDAYINRSRSRNNYGIMDIGATTTASKAIAFNISSYANPSRAYFLNWKLKGNDSSPFSVLQDSFPTLPLEPSDEFVRAKGSFSIIDGGDGYDRLKVSLNGYETTYEDIKVPQVEYNNWQSTSPYITIGKSAYDSPTSPNVNYAVSCRVREIKIYQID